MFLLNITVYINVNNMTFLYDKESNNNNNIIVYGSSNKIKDKSNSGLLIAPSFPKFPPAH